MEYFRREVHILKSTTKGFVEYVASNLSAERPLHAMRHYDRGSPAGYAGKLGHAQLRSVAKQLAACLAACMPRASPIEI